MNFFDRFNKTEDANNQINSTNKTICIRGAKVPAQEDDVVAVLHLEHLSKMENDFELVLNHIKSSGSDQDKIDECFKYISSYDGLIPYHSLANTFYFMLEKEDGFDLVSNQLSILINNIESDLQSDTCEAEKKKIVKSFLVKIWVHISLVNSQISLVDKGVSYQEKKMENTLKSSLFSTKSQILNGTIAILAIFTALAFLVVGNIISIDNTSKESSVLQFVLTWTCWSFTCFNTIFIFKSMLVGFIKSSSVDDKSSNAAPSKSQWCKKLCNPVFLINALLLILFGACIWGLYEKLPNLTDIGNVSVTFVNYHTNHVPNTSS